MLLSYFRSDVMGKLAQVVCFKMAALGYKNVESLIKSFPYYIL